MINNKDNDGDNDNDEDDDNTNNNDNDDNIKHINIINHIMIIITAKTSGYFITLLTATYSILIIIDNPQKKRLI